MRLWSGHLYITGGYDGQDCLSSVELFDPSTNRWSAVTSMRQRRCGHGLVSHDGMLYAVGGLVHGPGGSVMLKNGEKYNPANKTWTRIADMHNPRSNFGIEVS